MSVRIIFVDNTNFDQLADKAVEAFKKAGKDVATDMQYVTRGAAPFLSGQLEGDISLDTSESGDSFTAQVGVSTFRGSFDYGALHHDHPFQLGEGSAAKGGVSSPITGNYAEVGTAFASRPLEENAEEYIDYITEELERIFNSYS